MKIPILWLKDYLPEALDPGCLAEACIRWNLQPLPDPVETLGLLLTFCGFNLEGILGAGEDRVIDLDVLANRPDAQGLLGLAREISAVLRCGLKPPECGLEEGAEEAAAVAGVEVREPGLCPRYTARVIRGVKVQASPPWLQRRLRLMGLVPRNNIVDITNFVLFECNQPLHAFDLNRLQERRIVVRRAASGEPFTPLYDKLPPLTPETLVIADARRPMAIGGVIGGAGSEVTAETTDLLLESAAFDPTQIRRTCRRLKTGTDSSFRFERGVDLEALDQASARAAHLIVKLAGGTVCRGILDSNPRPREPKLVSLRIPRLQQVVGLPIPASEAGAILRLLGCQPQHESPAELQVRIPSWRRGDLEREIDLIEEVARIHGYDKIPAETAMSARIAPLSELEQTLDALRVHFARLGYFECITDTLVDPQWPAVPVWSPAERFPIHPDSVLREDHSQLRNNLLLSLLAVFRHNQDQRVDQIRLFECGKIFLPARRDQAPEERPVLGLVDTAGIQRLIEGLLRIPESLSAVGVHLKPVLLEQPEKAAFLDPASACRLVRVRELEKDGDRVEDTIGWLGQLHPRLAQRLGLKRPPAVAEIDLRPLATLTIAPRLYRPLPTQPEVVRDIAMVVEEAVSWGDIEGFARGYVHREPLRDPEERPRFLSVFRGKQIEKGRKSVAFSVVYRAQDRSLTDAEVNAAHERFTTELLAKFHAVLRT